MQTINGRIIKSLSGFYDVEAAEGRYTCKCRGTFRNRKMTPLVGDYVTAQIEGENVGSIISFMPRKNELTRPPVANADKMVIVASADAPKPNFLVLDKMTALAIHNAMEPIVVFTKEDLCDTTPFLEIYKRAGIPVISCSAKTGNGIEALRAMLLPGELSVFTGNSGVGKSSLLNALDPSLALETNAISYKLGRGKHTTRCVSLYKIGDSYVADTPGFSSLEAMEKTELIQKEALENCFPEFAPYLGLCRFTGCAHLRDKGCAVLAAAEEGLLASSRLESYAAMYEEVKNLKEWELK